jgi:K+-transporting ATPase ATPase C chain
MRLPAWIARHLAALRALLVLTVLTGLVYPLVLLAVAHLPGLAGKADGSLIERDGRVVGSRLIGQSFTDSHGRPLVQYFQSRPSAAGSGYDPTATAASNLGPEDVVDTTTRTSLLTLVCERSTAVGALEGVDGRRPYCTASGVGAVLAVYHEHGLTGPIVRVVSVNQTSGTPFLARYGGVPVELGHHPDADYSHAVITPIRGNASAHPAVPADAVTASGSGLDPQISVAYARLQAPRVARVRDIPLKTVLDLVQKHTTGRFLGFMGDPAVNVLDLNLDLDAHYPVGR